MVLSRLDNLILVGLRASGKTTLARALAQSLDRPFVDLDDELALRAGCTADELLAGQGEAAFRALERELLGGAAELRGRVIATGGGAVLHPREMAALAATGCVVYLDLPLPELLDRARSRPRPRLRPGSLEEELFALAAQRSSLYCEVAHITLSSPDVDSILDELKGWPQRPQG
jgi:shikimate kinase